ncbi:conjugal transfer protein TraO [Porphyromonas levii]|uniref:conjugal transfer protein TraO n=1 Tax=Porphyromonas levii TaxID=28114 RepID=UPI001B8B5F34|nr:conjugal transfer protein TraO [Porphyromonas levii]MBR8712262.1 hypothetical protein [Porphyromonas levii]MBR8714272.1 hypothetical protein [Porphyromonas levii]MBR8726813.1 hypothetical protein [Porphyromonas levii]MBR8735120.1 hypothetical protein [Porphyromonas levii]MBR8777221.1 hypothetical protein [Porphyromonas levii]
MNIKRLIALVVFVCTFSFLFPQEGSSQVMFVGTKMVTIKGGIPYRGKPFHTPGSFTAGVEYSQFVKSGNYWSVGLDAEMNNIPKKEFFIPELIATANGGYNLFLIGDNTRRLNFYASAKASLGYGLINKGEKKLVDGDELPKTQTFIYGGALGVHTDLYLTSRLTLMLGAGTKFLWGTPSNTVMRPYFEGGIKVSFF